jgi:NCAIR mutase (PurE)-related protein
VDETTLRQLVDDVRTGTISPDKAVDQLRRLPFADVEGASVDHHRHLRQGVPEAIYGPGKTPEQCARVVDELLQHGTGPVLLTRYDEAQRAACVAIDADVIELGGCLLWRAPATSRTGRVVVITAGTSDLPVAEEAIATLRAHGIDAELVADVGVAGLHRLLASSAQLRQARVLIVVAGMEGALPSVVGGMVDKPVIAVPTSVGYGASFGGVAALLGMLTSCASNVCVVNIDNGFGAAHVATIINRL